VLLIFDPRHNPLRSSVLVIAISSSLALLVVMSSLSVGVRESSREALDGVGSDIYIVPDSLNPILLDLQRFDQGWAVIREVEGSPFPPSHISPRFKDTLFLGNDENIEGEVIVHGVIPGNENHFSQFKVVKGTWFTEESDPVRENHLSGLPVDNDTFTREILVSEEFSRKNHISPGDTISLSPRMISKDPMIFHVRGIFVDTLSQRSESVMMHLGELQYMKGILEADSLTEILLAYPDGSNLDAVIDWSESSAFIFKDLVDLYTKGEFLSELYKFTKVLDGFSAIVISVTLFVCLIFTATIFMISTKERTHELSILRAIGFSPSKVFLFVIRESMIFYMIGAVAGFLLGLLVNSLLNVLLENMFDGLPSTFEPFRLDPFIVFWTLVATLLLSMFSGLLPAIISARNRPVTAIRGDL